MSYQSATHKCKTILIALVLTCPGALVACNQSHPLKETNTSSPDTQPAAKRYSLTGRVVSVDKPNKSIKIDGDEIPGFMAAMQMDYPVKDSTLLDKVTSGNGIKAEIVMASEGAYLENIVTADNPPAKGPAK
jgi:protein SCO1/2